MDPDTTVPEPMASHTNSGISKETESPTIIHATSTMTKVVTVPASDGSNEPVHSTEPKAANANPTKGPKKVTITEYKTDEVDNTTMSPSGKTNPTIETGLPVTPSTGPGPKETPTGMFDDTFQGLQVVPVTPQGFVTVTETKTETMMETKTTTETKTETVYIKPTVTVRVTDD